MRRISEDLLFTLVNVRPREEVSTLTHDYSTFQPGKYIACLYDGAWYVGYIRNRSEEHKDVEVEFMNRKGDAVSWPADTRRPNNVMYCRLKKYRCYNLVFNSYTLSFHLQVLQ